jgi:glutaredoxin
MTLRDRLYLYTREGCHLCEDMLEELAALRGELGFDLEVVDIDRDAELVRRFDTQVPVLALGEQVLCRYRLDSGALREAVSRAR